MPEIHFSEDHTNPTDCQLLCALTGPKSYIREKLLELVADLDSQYGKPCQGIRTSGYGVAHIITPVWDGRTFQ